MNYNDIWLEPNCTSDVKTRDDIDTSVKIGDLNIEIPIMNAPMVDVVDSSIATDIWVAGGLPILHRFSSLEFSMSQFLKCSPDTYCSIGINTADTNRYSALYDLGARHFCVDVANGANTNVLSFLTALPNFKKCSFIVGNFSHKNQIKSYKKFSNIVGYRMGVGPGAGCSTKNATGVLASPVDIMFNKKIRAKDKMIADGGIKEPGDLCKAIGMGANFGMLGASIAACSNSPAKEVVGKDNKVYKVYSGSASFEIQKKYKEPRYIEGITKNLEFNSKSVSALLSSYQDGLKSAMAYFGAYTIKEFQEKATFRKD